MTGNELQKEFWNGPAGNTWVELQERLDRMLEPLTLSALEAAAVVQGERVIDVGCGCGSTTIALVEQGASAWGIDLSAPMLERAKERAGSRKNIAFSQLDAAQASYSPDHHLLFSRFGVMFFADPYATFKRLRTSLVEAGRLTFLCWQEASRNPWMSTAGAAVRKFFPVDKADSDNHEPGPFAFADPDYVRDILVTSGYKDIEIAPVGATLRVASDLDDAIWFQSRVGPLARVLQELSGEDLDNALAAARDALADHLTKDGINLKAATWLVRARL